MFRVLLALVLSVAALQPARVDALESGQPLPAIAALEPLRGRVAYVDFWASWCGPCRVSMPALDALYRKHGPRGFAVIGVNKDVDANERRRFLERVPVSFPWVPDDDDRLARGFGVKAMPSGYLVDRRGVVRRVHRGFTAETAAALEKEIEALLGETK
jgi:cytochrome c biogenesis protein CcmG, thiol:disulfide interchange protein DsbE